MKVRMWLRAENNSQFVRERAGLREKIEHRVLSRYSTESLDKKRGEYLLSILYTTDVELDRIIYNEIWREA